MMLPTETPPAHVPVSDRMVWLKGTLDEPPWREIETFQPEVCVHFAWIATPGVYLESPENFKFRDASLKFLRAVNRLGTKHIVGLGTCVEYKITNEVLSEDKTPVEPTTPYAQCKNDLRLALDKDAKERGFVFAWTRVFYPYGPREHPSRLCSSIIQKLSRGEKIVLKTPDSTKDYIYIEDLAEALLTVVEKKFNGTINLGTGVGVSVKQIAQTLETILGRRGLVEEASPPQTDPLGFVVADAGRLKALGWRQQVTMEEGLRKLHDSIQRPAG